MYKILNKIQTSLQYIKRLLSINKLCVNSKISFMHTTMHSLEMKQSEVQLLIVTEQTW